MNIITQKIAEILFCISIIIIAIEGVFSLLDRMNFLPKFLERVYTSRDRRLVTMTLKESGLREKKQLIRQAMDFW